MITMTRTVIWERFFFVIWNQKLQSFGFWMSLIIINNDTLSVFLFCIRKRWKSFIFMSLTHRTIPFIVVADPGKKEWKIMWKCIQQIQRLIFRVSNTKKWFFSVRFEWNTKICWRSFSSRFIVFDCCSLFIGRNEKSRKNSYREFLACYSARCECVMLPWHFDVVCVLLLVPFNFPKTKATTEEKQKKTNQRKIFSHSLKHFQEFPCVYALVLCLLCTE